MQIVIVLLLLVVAVVLALVGAFSISLLLGVVLSRFPKAKPFAPVFILIIPCVAIGALSGGAGIGYLAIQHDENLTFLGPLGGIIIGGVVGLLVGTGLAVIWCSRRKQAQKDAPQS